MPLRASRFVARAEGETATTSEPAVPEVETVTLNLGDPALGSRTVPKQKSSWEIIEQPVRGGEGAPGTIPDGGIPVAQRNNNIDNLLINADGPKEKELTGFAVSWPDAFRFKGAAPEIINCRLAMLGAFAGLTAELATGRSIAEQFSMATGPIAFTFLLFTVASMVPISKGIPRKGAKEFGSPLTFLTSDLEVTVGRVAMLVHLLTISPMIQSSYIPYLQMFTTYNDHCVSLVRYMNSVLSE